MICTPILAMGEPMGPMEKGMTYSVRPAMQPLKQPRSVSRIWAGGAQLLVGPASSLFTEQMNVRSSTRPTSDGCERARYEFGRFSGLSRMYVPESTIIWQSRSYSSCDPSSQTTLSGLQSAIVSSTQAASLALFVGLVLPVSIVSSLCLKGLAPCHIKNRATKLRIVMAGTFLSKSLALLALYGGIGLPASGSPGPSSA